MTETVEREFWAKLDALLAEYPDICTQVRAEEPDGFDDDAPKVIDGIVLVVSRTNVQGWHECMWAAPRDQHPYLSRGMMHSMVKRL